MGVVRLILLVEDRELEAWGDPAIVELGSVANVEVLRHPMADGSPPSSVEAMDRILDEIDEARTSGDVVVACMGGVGRTGTVAACALVRAGSSARGGDRCASAGSVTRPPSRRTRRSGSSAATRRAGSGEAGA